MSADVKTRRWCPVVLLAVSSHRRNSHDGVIAKIAPRRLSGEASARVQIVIRAALAAWTSGDRSACFPEGTWWIRVVSRGSVWARAVAPRQSLNPCLRLLDASGGAEVQRQNDRGSADALHNTSFVQSALAL
jgi:hypothetical protein